MTSPARITTAKIRAALRTVKWSDAQSGRVLLDFAKGTVEARPSPTPEIKL